MQGRQSAGYFTEMKMNNLNNQMQLRIENAIRKQKYIETQRLFLVPLEVSDAPEMFKWCGDPEVTKFMIYSTYESVAQVEQWLAHGGRECFGFFLRENGQLIGSGDVQKNSKGVNEPGYNLAKAYWGKGYCTEACKALIGYAAASGVTDFYCEHAEDNVRSGRVIQKCGFEYVADGEYVCFDGVRKFKSKQYEMQIDSHQMNVDGQWFGKIANGSKTIELRLNDEKRRTVKVGDYIILNNLGESPLKKGVAKVTALHVFRDFDELYKNLDMNKCGYAQNVVPNPDDMLAYYSAERQNEFGVVGIEFELLCCM